MVNKEQEQKINELIEYYNSTNQTEKSEFILEILNSLNDSKYLTIFTGSVELLKAYDIKSMTSEEFDVLSTKVTDLLKLTLEKCY